MASYFFHCAASIRQTTGTDITMTANMILHKTYFCNGHLSMASDIIVIIEHVENRSKMAVANYVHTAVCIAG